MATGAGARGFSKIFVGGLPWTVGHRELKNYFQEFGRVTTATVVFDKKTGCSKGYGFVVFSSNKTNVLDDLSKIPKHNIDGYNINIERVHNR